MCTIFAVTLGFTVFALWIWLKISNITGKIRPPKRFVNSAILIAWARLAVVSLPLLVLVYVLAELLLPQLTGARTIISVYRPKVVPFTKAEDVRVEIAPLDCLGNITSSKRRTFDERGIANEVVPFERFQMHVRVQLIDEATNKVRAKETLFVPIYYRLGVIGMNVHFTFE